MFRIMDRYEEPADEHTEDDGAKEVFQAVDRGR